jgi:hypothetical protein
MKKSSPEIPNVPFDEALKRVWSAPPAPKSAKAKVAPKKKKAVRK